MTNYFLLLIFLLLYDIWDSLLDQMPEETRLKKFRVNMVLAASGAVVLFVLEKALNALR